MKTRTAGEAKAAKLNEIDPAFLRELRQLCHPDRHGNSPLSLKVMQRLNDIRKELDNSDAGPVQWAVHR